MLAQTGAEGRLACRSLTEAGRQDAAHVDLLDLLGRKTGAFDGGLDRRGTQVGSLGGGEGSLEPPHGRARERDDDDGIGHGDVAFR